jgi:hypothetical protein
MGAEDGAISGAAVSGFMFCQQNGGQYRKIKAANDSIGYLKFVYFCIKETNQNCIHGVKSR